ESASGSAPPLSLLGPLITGLQQSYWRASASTTSTELIIVLGNLSDVFRVVLLISPCGYSVSDSPTASNKIHKEERSCVGKWEVRSLITSSPELCSPEDSSSSVSFKKNTNLLSLDEDALSGMGRRALIRQ
ncbi:hypothetical protein Tco_1278980, partial [Tanacetum coccineum]